MCLPFLHKYITIDSAITYYSDAKGYEHIYYVLECSKCRKRKGYEIYHVKDVNYGYVTRKKRSINYHVAMRFINLINGK